MNAKETLNKIRELIDSYEFPKMPPTEDTYAWATLLKLRDFMELYEDGRHPHPEIDPDAISYDDVKKMISLILTEWYPEKMDGTQMSIYHHLHDARRNWIFGENLLEPWEVKSKKLTEAEATETIRNYSYRDLL